MQAGSVPQSFAAFGPYLGELEMPSELVGVCRQVFWRCSAMSPEPIEDIFISEYVADGKRRYQDFIGFSPNYCTVARDFTWRLDIQLLHITRRFTDWHLVSRDYVFNELVCDSGCRLRFRSTGKNNDHLAAIFEKYIKPNLALAMAGQSIACPADQPSLV
jgi:hypothetical protein